LHPERSLPIRCYFDPARDQREPEAIWHRHCLCIGRNAEIAQRREQGRRGRQEGASQLHRTTSLYRYAMISAVAYMQLSSTPYESH